MARRRRDSAEALKKFECIRTASAGSGHPAIYHQLIKTWGSPEDGDFDHTSVHVAVLRLAGGEPALLAMAKVLWIYLVQGSVEVLHSGGSTLLTDAAPQLERLPANAGVRVRVLEAPSVLILFCSDDPGGPIKEPPPKNPT